jgi:nicotinic acid mononucleotide adenylyltransferase/nicotinamide mononucleotide (NMN) deamidase PncC
VNRTFIENLHATPTRLVLAVTGGGSRAVAELLEVPGASRTVLEAAVPYCERALGAWLGGPPDQYCSESTARAMAMAAYRRACCWAQGADLAGVACTASLATDRPKRGGHRAHLAIQTASTTVRWSLELVKGRRTRPEEEQLVAAVVINAVAEACGLAERLPVALLAEEAVDERRIVAPAAWQALLAGETQAVCEGPSPRHAPQRALFPGAFNPIHAGHRRMAEIAQARLGVPVEFELSILNVDKPPLDFLEIARRLEAFGGQTLWLTRAATFEEKSGLVPGATFVVGADTLRRIADPRYYHGPSHRDAALQRIVERGCRFLVFGRGDAGQFFALDDLELPAILRAVCIEVPAEEFRHDIASRELRRAEAGEE